MPSPCLFLDPTGPYPERFFAALAARGVPAVPVFTTRSRHAVWEAGWRQRFGDQVVGELALWAEDDPDSALAALREEFPDLTGIIAWDEDNVLFGAQASQALGLGWNEPAVIERCRDKALMKAWGREHAAVRVNQSAVVVNAHEALDFAEAIGKWPVVVKPTRGSGSEDVYFAEGRGELLRWCQRVLESGAGEVLLEEYVGGREVAINGLVDGGGDLLVTDLWLYDRRDSGGRRNLYYEARRIAFADPLAPVLESYAREVVRALGPRRCPIHMEVKVDDAGPCLIEVGVRFGGIGLPILASRLYEQDLFALALDHYLESRPHRPDALDRARYDSREARVLLGIQDEPLERIGRLAGKEEVEALPSFSGWGLVRREGAAAPVTSDLDSRSWEVQLLAAGDLDDDAERARSLLRYEP